MFRLRPLARQFWLRRASLAALAIGLLSTGTLAAIEPGFTPLFNGQDLTGWQGVIGAAETCWRVEDAQLICNGERGTWLRSDKEYGDFCLRLEYQLQPGGNSGVYLRVPADGSHREGGGVEVQLLDDTADEYRGLEPAQYAGSVYKVVAAKERVGKPAGEWNTVEINCQGTHYRVTHNGVVVVDAGEQQAPELGQRRQQGFLGLQNHRTVVRYRNIRLGPPQPKPAAQG